MTGPVCQQIKAEVSSLCDALPGWYLIMYEIDIRAFGARCPPLSLSSLSFSPAGSRDLSFPLFTTHPLSSSSLLRLVLVATKLEARPSKSISLVRLYYAIKAQRGGGGEAIHSLQGCVEFRSVRLPIVLTVLANLYLRKVVLSMFDVF